ncbi:MAG: ammonium transporter, partial [Acidimicrobiales bacterium]
SVLLGFFADDAVNELGTDGLLLGGGGGLLVDQITAVIATLVYSFVVSFVIAKVLDVTMGIRVSEDDEAEGLDTSQHAETAYSLGGRIG